MAVDEFENIEAHLRDLEALKYYSQVKEERDSLTTEATQLKEKVAKLEAQLKTEIATKNELASRLAKTGAEVKELTRKLGEAEKELSSLREFQVKLADRGELTLEEMRDQFLHAEESEIEKRARERFQELEADIQSQMPSLVCERVGEIFKQPSLPSEIAKVVDSRAKQIADGILGTKDEWPDWFRSYYHDEVNALVRQGLTVEFERRAEAEAEQRLQLMKAGQWKEYATAKVKALASDLKDMLTQLQGTWLFTCDRCGGRVAIDLSPSHIGLLLRGQRIDITCTTCPDPAPFPFILSTVRHKIVSLSLEGLLELYMGSAPP
jgi:hypothetical protein